MLERGLAACGITHEHGDDFAEDEEPSSSKVANKIVAEESVERIEVEGSPKKGDDNPESKKLPPISNKKVADASKENKVTKSD